MLRRRHFPDLGKAPEEDCKLLYIIILDNIQLLLNELLVAFYYVWLVLFPI